MKPPPRIQNSTQFIIQPKWPTFSTATYPHSLVKDWGESVSELMIGKKHLQEITRSTLLLGCFYLLYILYSNLSRVYCC